MISFIVQGPQLTLKSQFLSTILMSVLLLSFSCNFSPPGLSRWSQISRTKGLSSPRNFIFLHNFKLKFTLS